MIRMASAPAKDSASHSHESLDMRNEAPSAASLVSVDTLGPDSARYKAKLDGVSPPSRRETLEQYEECFLGISLENSNFIRPKLVGILEWISTRFPRCTVLVGDSIHRITLESTRGLGPEAALDEGLRLGWAFVEQERHIFDGFADATHFSFLNCSEVQTWDAYATYHDRLQTLFQDDGAFRCSVEAFGRRYHRKHSLQLSPAEHERRLGRSSAYFLEEFAIFACLKQRGIGVMVYPGSFSTLAEIADGRHPCAPEELRELVVVSLHLRGR